MVKRIRKILFHINLALARVTWVRNFLEFLFYINLALARVTGVKGVLNKHHQPPVKMRAKLSTLAMPMIFWKVLNLFPGTKT